MQKKNEQKKENSNDIYKKIEFEHYLQERNILKNRQTITSRE